MVAKRKAPRKKVTTKLPGGHQKRLLVGNDRADAEAKAGLRMHPIDEQEHQDADGRTLIAAIVQHLIKTIWQKLFESDAEIKRRGDLDPPDLEEA